MGDGRSDSPGHCAKYGTYSLLDAESGKVLATEVVQSSEVGGAYHCELEGLKRALQVVGTENIHKLVTDRHRQIAKWLRENLPQILHCFDVWHVAKGISKKLSALGKQTDCGVVERWRHSIINHLYWCAATTEENCGDLLLAKWKSVMEHVCNNHDGFDDDLFSQCAHQHLDATACRAKEWIENSSKASTKLEQILLPKLLQGDVKRLSTTSQTSSLESFHSVMLMFTPKHTAYTYIGMKARTALAAMHWNANTKRLQAKTFDGTLRYQVDFKKEEHRL